MQKVRREPKTLAEIFFNMLSDSGDELVNIYYQLFSIMPEKELEANMQFAYDCFSGNVGETEEDKSYYKEWFYVFHKSVRQTDFFPYCIIDRPDPLTTPEEAEEYGKLYDLYHQFTKTIPEDPTLRPSEMVALWKKDWELCYPNEAKRLKELTKKKHNRHTESIGGHIDMILWNVIHLDVQCVLKKTMERAFNEYNIIQKYDNGRKQEQPADSGAQA